MKKLPRRWNGWGDPGVEYPLSPVQLGFLEERIGSAEPFPGASFETALAAVPAARLPQHPWVKSDPEIRLLHARGQSLPDWVDLRTGRVNTFPEGVAHPQDEDAVRELLTHAREAGASVIPYGGGTSVLGHINPVRDDRPALTMDMRGLNRLLELDKFSEVAAFQAGVTGPQLEAQLREYGFTLGHFPQSWEYSTLGGWIATRSTGQQALGYGRMEDLFLGGRLVTTRGPLNLKPVPASAAGPDVRHLVLGSEGRLGAITSARVRIRELPAAERFLAALLPDWEAGRCAAQAAARRTEALSMLRLSDQVETELFLALAELPGVATRLLRGRCLLIYGLTGSRREVRHAHGGMRSIIRHCGGLPIGAFAGEAWRKDRFRSPYLRNTLWERGYAVDTIETAALWQVIDPLRSALQAAILTSLGGQGERGLVSSHISHIYPEGASLYTTIIFRLAPDPDQTLERWGAFKAAASGAILEHGGTISHQHGIGLDHKGYLEQEAGVLGLESLRSVQRALDPDGIMNPGKLLD